MTKISIIIPTLNEAETLPRLLRFLKFYADERLNEVIVCDGGSEDNTLPIAKDAGAQVIQLEQASRPIQMNAAASEVKPDTKVLYFIHADTIPPSSYLSDIEDAVNSGAEAGCYRSWYGTDYPLLRINAWVTRFRHLGGLAARGGDQTFFITKNLFERIGGYKEDYIVMEDYDIIKRVYKAGRLHILDKAALVSTRKYDDNGYLRVTLANFVAFSMYRLGYHPKKAHKTYRKLVKYW